MAKKLVTYYSFEPSTNTVKIPGNIKAEKLLLITNITDNTPIYIFSDQFLGLESATYNQTTEETEFVLSCNCGTMSSTDKLQIFYDKPYVSIEPSETFVDAVSKFRVSNPENLIDTDFEYGPQASKWETLQTINNIPSFYSSSSDTTISFITKVESFIDSELITVTTSFDHGLTSGLPITVTGLSSTTAEGTYLIQSVPTTTTFTFKCRAAQPSSRELQGTYTSIIPGKFFQGSQIALDESQGIVSELYNFRVKVYSVWQFTLPSVPASWAVNDSIIIDSGGAGLISRIDGNDVYVWFNSVAQSNPVDGDTLTAKETDVVVTTVVGASNKFFINSSEAAGTEYNDQQYVQQETLSLAKKAIYTFDVSDTSVSTHPFEFSATDNGTHDGGTEYTTFVYKHGTQGTAGAYIRIYFDYNTPDNLYYYCGSHSGMGGDITTAVTTTSKVFLTTSAEHGFADNTNFYFVNTVSPKIFDIQDGSAIAADGEPVISDSDTFTNVITPDLTKTDPYNIESTYTLRFDEADINYGSDRITLPNHRFETGYSLLYYPNPGDTPIGGLSRMSVYYVKKIDDNTIELYDSMRVQANYLKNLSPGGTFTHGQHNLGLVYNIYREQKGYNNWYTYYYPYYNNFGSTYSGYDLRDNQYGLGGQNWDRTIFFSQTRSHAGGNSGNDRFRYCDTWFRFFNTFWKTYGYNHVTLPLGTSAQFQGVYDMLTDTSHNGYSNNSYANAYWVGALNGNGPAGVGNPYYWTSNFYIDYVQTGNSPYIRMRGNNWFFWYHQNGRGYNLDRRFGSHTSDGGTNMYIMFGKQNTTTNDSIYKENHLAETGHTYTLDTTSGDIHYYTGSNATRNQLGNGTSITTEKIDANRVRLKDTSNNVYRLAAVTGAPTLSGTFTSPFKNSIFVAEHQFSNNEYLRYDQVGSAPIAGLVSGNSYYVKVVDANRFQLGSTVGFSTEIDFTNKGTGLQSFENTTAAFGTTDGSYTTTKAVSDTKLSVTIPFKIPPALKGFDANANVTIADDYITINNHYFATGTRVIYDAQGGTPLGGLTDGADYYIIVIDNNIFKLATTLADSVAGNAITISTKPGSTETQQFISASMSGQVSGTGTVEVTSGSRLVTGSNAAFQRFYKIGDKLRIVNNATTPGVIVEKTITAITDDDNMLVDTTYDFSNSGLNYLIPSYIYVRPDGFYLHRPFDGGMEIGTSKSPNSRISRQTRKYFRYQSGKGIQTSFAINFIPQVPVQTISYTPIGTTTVVTGAAMTTGGSTLTVSDTSALTVGQIASGEAGLGTKSRIVQIIDATTLEMSTSCTGTFTGGTITFARVELATIVCTKPHQFESDVQVTVKGCSVEEFNITGDIYSIENDFSFRYLLPAQPTSDVGGGFTTVSIVAWSDCSIRAGMFDDQNGFYFEYDGATLNCVRRSSVQQLPGTIAVANASQIITGTNTSFISQVAVGEHLVIRGMTYQVVKIASNSQLTIQPSYRGVSATDVICTKTINTAVAKENWNIDKADGDGPSGYILNLDRIQMCYMDYSWYGAGKIRFGFKDQDGHVKYVHEFKHNNRLTESYFRSGNLPARYEVVNFTSPTYVGTLFHWGTSVIMDGTMQDDEAYLFTASGNVQKYTNATAESSSTNANSFLRSYYQGTWWNRTFYLIMRFPSSEASKFSINTLIYENTVANGYFLEGRPIDSKSRVSGSYYEAAIQYVEGTATVFPYNYTNQINSTIGNPAVPSGTTMNIGAPAGVDNIIPDNIPLISIRLAPSVDSSITGALGEREIINRMQLKLDSVGILTTHETELSLILNPQLSTDEFQNVDEPSLCQLVKHGPNDVITGGSKILSFRASGSGDGNTFSTEYDLTKLSDLGNSILGGDGVYPNGPDLLCVVANIVDSTGVSVTNPYSVSARVTWQESQA